MIAMRRPIASHGPVFAPPGRRVVDSVTVLGAVQIVRNDRDVVNRLNGGFSPENLTHKMQVKFHCMADF